MPAQLLLAQSGQTVTEFLMLSGLLTASAITVLTVLYGPAQEGLQNLTQCIIDGAINGVSCVPGAASPEPPPNLPPDPAPQPPPPPPSPPPDYYPQSTCGFEGTAAGITGYTAVVATGTTPGWPGLNGVPPQSVTVEPETTCSAPRVITGSWFAQVIGAISPSSPACQVVFTVCYPGRCVTARAQFGPSAPISCRASVQ